MYDIKLWQRATCSKRDKKKIIPVIDILVNLSKKAVKEGLLAIADDIPGIDSQFIKKGLSLIVDGTDPGIVKEILLAGIYAGNFSGRKLLTRMIAADGMLCIQTGIYPAVICLKLYSYLGEEFGKGLYDYEAFSGTACSTRGTEAIADVDIDDNRQADTFNEQYTPAEPVIDEPCRIKLTNILSENKRIFSAEPFSETEVQTLSDAIKSSANGVDTLINILKSQPVTLSRQVLTGFELFNPDIYNELMKKWIVFEDLVRCSNRSIQKILREIDTFDLTKALKGAGTLLSEKIFSNMSNRAAMLIKEDIEYIGPIPVEDVEDAQNKIVKIALKLQEAGDIVIMRPGERLI